jgi:hypothetical protein
VDPTQLHLFYEDLVGTLRDRGVLCAITSGLACVHYGIAETTKDCDLLCHPNAFGELLNVLSRTRIEEVPCSYRGNISPPLDARWHEGGWTSHFEWVPLPTAVTLDVFGHALRESSPWERETLGLYASPQTVAEMKRTNRDKDWGFITALGVRMLEADDERGWLHIFNAATMAEMLRDKRCPSEMVSRRPALALAVAQDPKLPGALNAERRYWEELDRRRIQILERHLRPYVSAVRKARAGKALNLAEEHAVRIDCAGRHLPMNPLRDYGLQRYLDETREGLVASGLVPQNALSWLPDVMVYFKWLSA